MASGSGGASTIVKVWQTAGNAVDYANRKESCNMEIKLADDGNVKIISLVGRLDTNTSPQLEECAGKLYEEGVSDIVVDMAECGFVSSAGLRVIVAMQKRAAMGGSLVFRNVASEVMEVFQMTGFDRILTFE